MSIDILNLGYFASNKQAVDVALPVLAIECEATPPLENYLDVYEETVLRLISIGLSTQGISKALNATESLIDKVLTNLEEKQYAKRESGKPWELTEDGEKFINGSIISERTSSKSKYGFMFINVIKKEVLPYFYQGNVGQISLFRGSPLPLKLTIKDDEETTAFKQIDVNKNFKRLNSKLKKAYKAYCKYLSILSEYNEGNITKEEADDFFADMESFDEEIEEEKEEEPDYSSTMKNKAVLKKNMFIRALNNTPKKMYLRMRIIIDPSYPGGYRVESPFDFRGIDNNYFLRQIQWMELSDKVCLDRVLVKDFLNKEICKISPYYKHKDKDYQVFLLEKMPLLKLLRSRMPYVYEDMERIYSLIQIQQEKTRRHQQSLLEKENIVNNLARYVVESLFNTFFRPFNQEKLNQIQQKAFDDISTYGKTFYIKRICKNVKLDDTKLKCIGTKYLQTIVKRLSYTYGNSIVEKFVNMLIVDYYISDNQMHKFLIQSDINQKLDLIDKLNQIRRKVSHDTIDRFSIDDYNTYMADSFGLINSLLEAFRED